jgi:hypothetical protein
VRDQEDPLQVDIALHYDLVGHRIDKHLCSHVVDSCYNWIVREKPAEEKKTDEELTMRFENESDVEKQLCD